MSLIEGFWIKNFGPLRNVAFGTSYLQTVVVEEDDDSAPTYSCLGPISLIIGKSDVGKTSVMDAFHFLADALTVGLEDACIKRGGFEAIQTQGATGPISIGVNFRVEGQPLPLTYAINVGATRQNTPRIISEALVYRSTEPGVSSNPLLLLQNEQRIVKHIVMRDGADPLIIAKAKQTDNRHLALSILGQAPEQYPDVYSLREYLESWYLSCYTPHEALGLSPVLPQKHMYRRGDSLVHAVREMDAKLKDQFPAFLNTIAQKMPGIETITVEKTESGRILLYFRANNCPVPFSSQRISDGLLRLFAHLMLLEDPIPCPFVGVEEPENGLDQSFLDLYIESLIRQVVQGGQTQFLITTHSPTLIDRVRPEFVWVLEKIDGETRVQRASDDPIIREVIGKEQSIPENWFSSSHFF